MKYFLDTEFHEFKKKPLFSKKGIDTIELISIGIVSESVTYKTYSDKLKTNQVDQDYCPQKEYYAICNEFDVKAAWDNEWLRENVLKNLFNNDKFNHYKEICSRAEFAKLLKHFGKSKYQISKEILQLVGGNANELQEGMKLSWECNTSPEFYAYYADYDWVVFCWLFGRMIDLPKGFPMYCKDLKQMLDDKDESYESYRNKMRENLKSIKHPYKVTTTKLKYEPDFPIQKNEHNALDDAKWNKRLYEFLKKL